MVVVECDPKLFQLVRTLSPSGSLTRGLNRRKQKGNQNADDSDHHQQFDERERSPVPVVK